MPTKIRGTNILATTDVTFDVVTANTYIGDGSQLTGVSSAGFINSTITTPPGSEGNIDLAGGESPFQAIADAFGVPLADIFDNMEQRGTTTTVDLGAL